MYDKILFKNNTADLSRRLYFASFVLSPGTFNKSFNMKTPSTAINKYLCGSSDKPGAGKFKDPLNNFAELL